VVVEDEKKNNNNNNDHVAKLTFIAFKKFHPHDTNSIIRVAYKPSSSSTTSVTTANT